jgi:hypothetical protein
VPLSLAVSAANTNGFYVLKGRIGLEFIVDEVGAKPVS